ncbi:flavin-containing monooxygenase [Nocardia aurantiaca]|uniref:NAD(P)-binding protein n=1 Tax=Nocardia aurantiaca TaxID=2675850 RepID=A0A6I3L5Z5_9NOCA|nr:NAD(P)/FAD-dependent oxidoreductase [Nocardia aurantiaca]MTE15289.1 NAD(P)-binding protein [Nocardia aurantiaca]
MGAFASAERRLGHVDVLIVGAGISGIGMGCHLTSKQPGRDFAIVDGRDAIGGTWDLFRYPGIRSDSDLHTFGYEFKPWTSDNAIADAHEILDYLREAVVEHDLERRIHLGHKVLRANWSSADDKWTVTLRRSGDEQLIEVTCNVLFCASGYYDYTGGFDPVFEGREDFSGPIIHPQAWPEGFDYTGKRVVVIGSGATAVTIVPAMAEDAAHVTMLQRSPSYVLAVPRQDPVANTLRRLLPDSLAYRITRRLNLARQRGIYLGCKRYPKLARRLIRAANRRLLPDGYAVDTHFNPDYNPWDQRLCMVPDADMFKAISAGRASVVTDRISRFTSEGILLESGAHLEADVIVTATGLRLLPFGGIEVSVDGQPVDPGDRLAFKGMMLSGVPNFAFIFGYTNTSWTMKVDLVCDHLCRILEHMDRRGHTSFMPVDDDPTVTRKPMLDFPAGYVQRAIHLFPQRGSHDPWTIDQHFGRDKALLREGPVEDPALRFATRRLDAHEPSAAERVIA